MGAALTYDKCLPLQAQADSEQFPYVIFCAPPSGSDDYEKEARARENRPPCSRNRFFLTAAWEPT